MAEITSLIFLKVRLLPPSLAAFSLTIQGGGKGVGWAAGDCPRTVQAAKDPFRLAGGHLQGAQGVFSRVRIEGMYGKAVVLLSRSPDWACCGGLASAARAFHAGFIIGSPCASFRIIIVLLPFLRDLREERFPPRWILIGAAVPTAIDFAGGVLGLFANTFSFAGADRCIIRSRRRFLRDARPRFGVEWLARQVDGP